MDDIYVDIKSFDTVKRPKHYADKEIEVIDYIKDTLTKEQSEGYCIGNIIKYISRYKAKGGMEDLKKAQVYLGWAIAAMDKKALVATEDG